MMRRKNDIIRKALLIAGMCLLLGAMILFVLWQWNINTSAQKTNEYVSIIQQIIPESEGATLEERRDNEMATLSIDGIDFVGLLEFPQYGSVLPVCDDWGNPSKYPCRFSGSVYDRTMQIGGTSQKGQYDFYRDISVGDSLFFTDMEGNRYTYEVKDIRYEDDADRSTLDCEESSLTLFIKNIYAFEYIVVNCE